MGVKGFTNYMKTKSESDKFLKPFELHDTDLVIDGVNVLRRLYENNCDRLFGGDYTAYSKVVSEFFDNLKTCNVTPIVVMDGGKYENKISQFAQNMKKQILAVRNLSKYKIITGELPMPSLVLETFLQVTREKKIECKRALFDVDAECAFLANALDCPVLSCDSDFFIFNATFIHFNTFMNLKPRQKNGKFFLLCKNFKFDYLRDDFPNLLKETWPLLAVFLGNDYVEKEEFEKFLNSVILSNEPNKDVYLHNNIDLIIKWLENRSLNSAVSEILSFYDEEDQRKKISIIENAINEYLFLSITLLEPLGYSQDKISSILRKSDKPYKFVPPNSFTNELDLSKVDLGENCDFLSTKLKRIHNLKRMTAAWFLVEFESAKFHPSLLNSITQGVAIQSSLQIEDLSKPAFILISIKIIRVIYKLMNNGTVNSNTLTILARGQNNEVQTYEWDCSDLSSSLPELKSIPNLSNAQRKKILLDTVSVSDSFLVKFPPKWRIFMAALKYWKKEAEDIYTTDCHLYALVYYVFLHIINEVIEYGSYLISPSTQQTNQSQNNHSVQSRSIKQVLENLNQSECNEKNKKKLFNTDSDIRLKNFDVTIVHSYTLFQCVLKNVMILNTLLQCPYSEIKVQEFFDGFMVYKLYCQFQKVANVKNYIVNKLSLTPNLQNLFVLISDAVE